MSIAERLAEELAEQGWLERRFVTEPGELSWWWTPKADTGWTVSALLQSTERREN